MESLIFLLIQRQRHIDRNVHRVYCINLTSPFLSYKFLSIHITTLTDWIITFLSLCTQRMAAILYLVSFVHIHSISGLSPLLCPPLKSPEDPVTSHTDQHKELVFFLDECLCWPKKLQFTCMSVKTPIQISSSLTDRHWCYFWRISLQVFSWDIL